MKVQILRVGGEMETLDMKKDRVFHELRKLIAADGFDTVDLRDGRVMIVDDTGMVDGKPVNKEATELYWSVCRSGTTHPICGDVAIARDEDFA